MDIINNQANRLSRMSSEVHKSGPVDDDEFTPLKKTNLGRDITK